MTEYTWARSKKRSAQEIPDSIKKDVEIKADSLIDRVLKPKYIEPPPEDNDFNYLVDIFSKWYRGYFYFCSNTIVPPQMRWHHPLTATLPG